MAVTWKKLAYEADVMLNTVADANSVLYAVTDNTPAALAMAASTMVARLAAGDIVAATPTEVRTLLNVENGADVTDATNVASAGAVMESDFTAKGGLIAGSGVGTAVELTVGANGKVLKALSTEVSGLVWGDAGVGDFLASGAVPMTGNLDFAEHQALDVILHTVADNTALLALANPVVGKIAFQTDALAAYICTVAI
ncbi:MAG: hypothetical protein ABIJ40_09525 [Bacteroidota bacterium]